MRRLSPHQISSTGACAIHGESDISAATSPRSCGSSRFTTQDCCRSDFAGAANAQIVLDGSVGPEAPGFEVPAGEAMTLAAAWGAFDAEGRDFWTGMDALVDMLDGLAPAEDADA